jgi:hypothetical protein
VNWEALSQVECLCVLQVTGPHERKALEKWVSEAGADRKLVGELPGLARGEGYVWSPAWLRTYQRVRFATKQTFDASATPEVGRSAQAATLSAMDVEALRTDMAEIVEKAQVDDPKALRQRISALEADLRKARSASPAPDPAAIARAVEEVRRKSEVAAAQMLKATAKLHKDLIDTLDRVGVGVNYAIEKLRAALANSAPDQDNVRDRVNAAAGNTQIAEAAVRQMAANAMSPGISPRRSSPPAGEASEVGGGALRMLRVLAQRASAKYTRAQWGTLAGLAPTGGTFSTYLSRLRTAGYLTEEGGYFSASDAGMAAAGEMPPAPQSTEELVAMWQRAVGGGAARMLDVLVAAYPESLTRERLAEDLDMAASGGTFSTYLSRLRSNGLAKVQGQQVKAGSVLFDDVEVKR